MTIHKIGVMFLSTDSNLLVKVYCQKLCSLVTAGLFIYLKFCLSYFFFFFFFSVLLPCSLVIALVRGGEDLAILTHRQVKLTYEVLPVIALEPSDRMIGVHHNTLLHLSWLRYVAAPDLVQDRLYRYCASQGFLQYSHAQLKTTYTDVCFDQIPQ